MQYKPIENCHIENAILGKNFNLAQLVPYFMLSLNHKLLTLMPSNLIVPCDSHFIAYFKR
jgi:hypothetical protein